VLEPAREIPVIGEPDVLVVGAGAAGISAAVAAARRGADVWLLEGSGRLGGLATFGLINLLLTLDDGAGTQVVGGLCQETIDRLGPRAVFPPAAEWNRTDSARVERWRRWGLIWGAPESVRYSVAFDPEDLVDVSLDMLGAAGARLRLHTWFADVAMDGDRIAAVFVESKRGREAIVPRCVVDATGDGDVFVRAGAPFESIEIPPYLWFRVGGVVGEPKGAFAFRTTAPGRYLVPWGPHADRVDPFDPDAMTAATLACRAAARDELERLRLDVPGFESAWLDDYASMLGITESRRLVGDHVMVKEDADVRLPDAVARTGHWTRRDVVFDVPLRAMTTATASNLVVAGRCISTSRYVHQATKEIPAAMATGEAAGAAAARATDGNIRAVDVAALRTDLSAAGAIV
jgi:2-polyprenyl-6-methoxyphenol hydroxylase-like FAD-dependent oxidoreductase